MRINKLYAAAVALVFLALAAARADLVILAAHTSLHSLSSGSWLKAARVLFGMVLLGYIILAAVRTLAADPDPVLDGFVVLAASVYGYLAELAGTTFGLWVYYTGERPPLWIVPAWPIGALMISRLSRRAGAVHERLFGRLPPERLYWAWVLLFYSVFIPFTAPKLTAAESLLAAAAAAAVFLFRGGDRKRDFSLLLTGTACVFWADLWGTGNHCWSYHTSKSAAGAAAGVLFGMLFNSAVVLASVKTGETLRGLLPLKTTAQ